jgi:hypothetical protein
VNPKASREKKLQALPKVGAFYGTWYPTRWVGWGRWPRFAEWGTLATHLRYLERTTRRLARSIFHMMALHGPKLEKRQALLFRAVDIGANLFAMSAAVSRAQTMREAGDTEAARAAELADVFCRMTRRKNRQLFLGIFSNDDVRNYRTARRVLDGEHAWLEEGLVPTEELRRMHPPAPHDAAEKRGANEKKEEALAASV